MGEGLQQRPRQRQARADQQGDQASWQSKVLHQRLRERWRMARQQGVKGIRPGNRNG